MNQKENTSLAVRIPWWSLPLIGLFVMEAVAFTAEGFQVMGNTLHDYDTVTRLAYIRDVMARGGWQQGFFDRINAPYGMRLHWTLPFNLIVLGIAKLFALVKADTALHYAGYWTGTIFRVIITPAAYWAGREILSPVASAFAASMILFSPYLLDYGHRGAANHHVLLVLDGIVLAGLAFRIANRPTAQAWLPLTLGVAAGFCLWTTFELVILIGPLFLSLFVMWIVQGEARLRQLLLCSAGFTITVSLALLADTPYGGLGAVQFDHISAPFQSLATLPLIIALGGLYARLPNQFKRFRYFVASGVIGSAFWLACYSSAIDGVQGQMDPYVAREWLNQIEEVQPIHEWRKVAVLLGPGLMSLVLIFNWRNKVARDAALMGMGFLYIVAQLHFRFSGYLTIGAAFFLGYVFDAVRRQDGQFPARFYRYSNYAAGGLAGFFYVAQVLAVIFHYDVMSDGKKDDIPDAVTCNPYTVRAQLSDRKWLGVDKEHPIVANEVNDAAELVYWTEMHTLAGNYHRDSQGIHDDYSFFRDMGEDNARTIALKRGIDFVLLCGNGNNVSYSFVSVEKAMNVLAEPGEEFDPQNTMYTRLTDQQPPAWLKLRDWPDDIDTDLLLYQVDKSKLTPISPR